MRRGGVARAETQRSGGGELDVNGYELLGEEKKRSSVNGQRSLGKRKKKRSLVNGQRGRSEHRTSKGRGMLDFEF